MKAGKNVHTVFVKKKTVFFYSCQVPTKINGLFGFKKKSPKIVGIQKNLGRTFFSNIFATKKFWSLSKPKLGEKSHFEVYNFVIFFAILRFFVQNFFQTLLKWPEVTNFTKNFVQRSKVPQRCAKTILGPQEKKLTKQIGNFDPPPLL